MTDNEARDLLAILEADIARRRRAPHVVAVVETWPCDDCGADGVRNVGSRGYCSTHLAVLYRRFDKEAFIEGGVGLPDGKQQPEYGPGIEELRCVRCDATWSGLAGDTCWWCQQAIQRQREHQADLVLEPPDVHPDDVTIDARFQGWRQRLAVAIDAGLITSTQAASAWRRAIDRVAEHAA